MPISGSNRKDMPNREGEDMNKADNAGIIAFLSCILGLIILFAVIDFNVGWLAPISAYSFLICGYYVRLNQELKKGEIK